MNKTLKKKTGLFDDQWLSEDFWNNQNLSLPSQIDHKSFVYIKTSKKLLKEYTIKTLVLSDSTLYLVGKKTNKVYKSIDLATTPCKLYDYILEKSKYRYKLVLRHHSLSAEFFFTDQKEIETWIAGLRTLCLMCDFTSVYSMGSLQVNSTLFRVFWAQEKTTGKPYSANVYNLFEDSNNNEDDDIQSKIEKQVIVNEIKALRSIDHQNILQLIEVHEFKDRVVMVTELITGSTLLRHILSQGALPELETTYIMKTILQAIQALHKKKILHRNLKPENIILNHSNNGTEIKITSFGFSCSFDKAESSTWHVSKNICSKCGTPGYMAPELLGHKKSLPAGDVFSLGVILFTCLTGEPMFKGRTAEDIIVKNLKVNIEKSRKWYMLSENGNYFACLTHLKVGF